MARIFAHRKKDHSQSGINMVDLMMWLVIAALLLAAAIQGIGYYQKAAYIYQMNAAAEKASGAAVAQASIDGTTVIDATLQKIIDDENAATPNDKITLSWGSVPVYASGGAGDTGFSLMSSVESATPYGSERLYIKAVHESVNDKDSVYFFDNTSSYRTGVNVVAKNSLLDKNLNATPAGVEPGYGFTDGSLTWKPVNPGTGAWYSMTSSNDGKHITAMDRYGMFYSNDSAATWGSKSVTTKLYTLAAASEGPFLIAGSLTNSYTSMDYGATWTTRTQPFYRVIASKTGDKLFGFLGHGSAMVTSTDYGATWSEVTSAGKRKWQGIAASDDAKTIIVGTNDSYVLLSRDGGVTWTEPTGPGTGYWYAVAVSADGKRMAAANHGGGIWTSNDSGITWTEQKAAGVKNWNAMTISSDGSRLAAATDDEYLYTSVDGGFTWSQHSQFGVGNWQATSITRDGNKVFAANYAGQMYEGTFNNR